MSIAKEGWPLIFAAAAVTLLAFLFGWKLFGLALVLLTLAVAAFFRDPERSIPNGDGLVVSPADGRVVAIAPVQGDSLFADAVTRISIFLSPLDVHINRAPVAGRVNDVRYQAGKFVAAYKEDASRVNEQNALRLVDRRTCGAERGVQLPTKDDGAAGQAEDHDVEAKPQAEPEMDLEGHLSQEHGPGEPEPRLPERHATRS